MTLRWWLGYAGYMALWVLLAGVLCRALPSVPTVLTLPVVVGAGLLSWLDAVEAV